MPDLFDRHAVGYTEMAGAHGVGETGRREGSRAWPGDAAIYFSIVPSERVEELMDELRSATPRLQSGERLHAAVLPTDTFF